MGTASAASRTRRVGRGARALRTVGASAIGVRPCRRERPCVRAVLGSDARPFGHARAARRRFVPFVRRSAGRAVLDPPRRSGSETDPPVFYGGKPGKSLTAIPIMDAGRPVSKHPAAFACCELALILRPCGRRGDAAALARILDVRLRRSSFRYISRHVRGISE